LWGLFLITTPDPNRPGRDRELRVWCRRLGVASALFVGAGMLSHLAEASFFSGLDMVLPGFSGLDMVLAAAWLSGAATLILTLIRLSLYLRRLARRGEDKGLIKMMTTLVWSVGALVLLWPALKGLSVIAPAMPVDSTFPIAVLTYGIAALVALVRFRRVLAAERERAAAATPAINRTYPITHIVEDHPRWTKTLYVLFKIPVDLVFVGVPLFGLFIAWQKTRSSPFIIHISILMALSAIASLLLWWTSSRWVVDQVFEPTDSETSEDKKKDKRRSIIATVFYMIAVGFAIYFFRPL
ncbi:MAG: hypothetical protein IH853_12465, partial [Bacteroidetes bacterium]|nr:hypothetical protein [Bacteroidota bacterium]